jgi:hypothetical protein
MADDPRRLRRLLVREVNEEIRRVNERFGIRGSCVLLCECCAHLCLQRVELPVPVWERVRGDGHFVVCPGHRDPELDDVVVRADGYWVVAATP